MPLIPYFDPTAVAYEKEGEWSMALTRWNRVLSSHPGNAAWILKRIDYCIRRMSRSSSTQTYAYDSYSYQ